jgi:hypothetical protein
MIIHASDRIEVRHEAADSGTVWVFFASDADAGQINAAQGMAMAKRAGVAAMGVDIRNPKASCSDDLAAAAAAIRAVTGRYHSVVALGHGCGADAALWLGKDIGAEAILAFSPLQIGALAANGPIASVANRYVFRDRYCSESEADASASGYIGVDHVTIPMPFAGRDTLAVFAGTPALTALVEACRSMDLAQVRSIASHARRRCPRRVPALVMALSTRRPRLADRVRNHHGDRFRSGSTAALTAAGPGRSARPGRAPASPPTITVFGSCRVYNPGAILAADGRAKLNQGNIFGFVHCAAEVLQQLRLITGETLAPTRLRPYLNIGDHWRTPPPPTADALAQQFAATDVFVVEVSSLRHLRFKAFLLQINRTRELLAADPDVLRDWWTVLLKTGRNNRDAIPRDGLTPTARELMEQVTLVEQPASTIRRDIEAIARRLGKPVLFVSHFNVDMAGAPIAQRSTIVEAFNGAGFAAPCDVLDPTGAVKARGIDHALADAAHYQPKFERELADIFAARIAALRVAPCHRHAD